jgi:hypothetical protein
MSDLSFLSYYHGIEVRQGNDGIFQSAYAGKLLQHCRMNTCNPSASPMESHLKLNKVRTDRWTPLATKAQLAPSATCCTHGRTLPFQSGTSAVPWRRRVKIILLRSSELSGTWRAHVFRDSATPSKPKGTPSCCWSVTATPTWPATLTVARALAASSTS